MHDPGGLIMNTLTIFGAGEPILTRYRLARERGVLQFPSPAVEDGRWADDTLVRGLTVSLTLIKSVTGVEEALAKIDHHAFSLGLAALVEIAFVGSKLDPKIPVVGLLTTFTHQRLKGNDTYSPMLFTGNGGRGIGAFRWKAKLQPGMMVASVMLA